MASWNCAGERKDALELLPEMFRRSHYALMALPETRVRNNHSKFDEPLLKRGLGVLSVPRPPGGDGGSTGAVFSGGGVAIVYDTRTTTATLCSFHEEGAIFARIEHAGAPPFHAIALYLPTSSSPRAAHFGPLLEWCSERIRSARATDAPYTCVLGDFNAAIGAGDPSWGRQAVDMDPSSSPANDALLLSFAVDMSLKPAHGLGGHVARSTSQTPPTALKRRTNPELVAANPEYGRRERDYILVPAGTDAIPIEPTDQSPWPPSGTQHRLISADILVVGSKIAAAPPKRHVAPPIRVPVYANKEAWMGVHSSLESIVEKTERSLAGGASTADAISSFNALLRCLTDEKLRPLRPPPGKKPPPGKRTMAIPAEAVLLFRQARRLARKASTLMRKGRTGSVAAGQEAKAASRNARKEGMRICAEQRATSVERLIEHLSNTATEAPSRFWKELQDDAVEVYSTSRLIPDGPDGKASDTFPRAAERLFSEEQPDPPAIRPESGDTYTRHVPRPLSPIEGGALGKDFTTDEFYTALFGPPPGRPPAVCEHSTCTGRPCPICIEARARYEAARVSETPDNGKSLRTSVAAGPDGIPAEVFCWARHAAHVPGNDIADKGATFRLRRRLCALLAEVSNDMLKTGRVPKGFTMAHVKLLLKEGRGGAFVDPTLFASYRPISVISLVHKILKLVMTKRFSHYWVSAGIIGPAQAGFSHRLSTENNILLVFETLRRRCAANENTWALFVDICRAYDTVNHNALLHILRTAGIADNMVNLIKALLADASFRLEINGSLSDPIPVRVGLPQGDPLSCVLFLVYIESLARYLDAADAEEALATAASAGPAAAAAAAAPPPARGVRTAGVIVRDALYADDFVGLAPSHEETVRTRRLIERWMDAWSMTTNAKAGKSEYLLARPSNAQAQPASQRSPALPVIPCPGKPPWSATWSYRLLGVGVQHDLQVGPYFDGLLKSTVGKFNALLYHKSSVMRVLPPARLLQLRKVMTQFYALSVLTPPKATLNDIGDFLHTSAAAIWRLPRHMTSRLLVSSISASPSAFAILLKERLRLFLGLRCHPSRLAALDAPRPVSLVLYDALVAEDSGPRQPNAPPNWVSDTRALLRRFDATPIARRLEDFGAAVQWAFDIPRVLRPFITGVTYVEARLAYRNEILHQDAIIGVAPPRLNGSTNAASYYTCGMNASPTLFEPGARPSPVSMTGPGFLSIVSIAVKGRYDAIVRTLAGNSCLWGLPWSQIPGESLPPALRPPVAAPAIPANRSSYQGCALCGGTDSAFHIAAECSHPAIAGARVRLLRSAFGIFLPRLIRLLSVARLRPADRGRPVDLLLSAEEQAALDGISSLALPGAMPPELQHVLYRLLTASPWPAHATLPEHRIARGLGKFFDACIADKSELRELANVWAAWASLSLTKLAEARWAALTAEAADPSLPRPPPWQRPAPLAAAPPLPAGLAPAALPDWGDAASPPPEAYLAPIEHHATSSGVSKRWFESCGRGALADILRNVAANHQLSATLGNILAGAAVQRPINYGAMSKAKLVAILLKLRMYWDGNSRMAFHFNRYLPAPAPAGTATAPPPGGAAATGAVNTGTPT